MCSFDIDNNGTALSLWIVCALQSETAGIPYSLSRISGGRFEITSGTMNCLCEERDAHYCQKLPVEMRNVAPRMSKTIISFLSSGIFKRRRRVETCFSISVVCNCEGCY